MSFRYNRGAFELGNGGIVLETAPLKLILVTAAYVDVADPDDEYVSQLNATNDPGSGAAAEITASAGYVGGFSGSGRVLLGGQTWELDHTNDRAALWSDHRLWNALTTTDVIAGAVLCLERTSDGDSPLLYLWDGAPFPTPGGGITAQDLVLKFPEGDNVRGIVLAL